MRLINYPSKFILVLLSLLLFFINTSFAASIAGTDCKKAGDTKTVAGKKYTCIKSASGSKIKLIWNKGITLPAGSTQPTPTPSSNALPVLPATPAVPVASVEVGSKSYLTKLSKPYKPTGQNGGTDDYRCFLVDPQIKENSYITSVEFLPETKELVHHAILFRVTPAQADMAKAKDINGDGWTCFGGTGIGDGVSSFLTSPWLSSWAPGRGKDVLPEGLGVPFDKGSKIVLQVHYNLLHAAMSKTNTDQSSVAITAVSSEGSKLIALNVELLPAPVELACPAGISGPLCDRNASLFDLAQRTSTESAIAAAGLGLICGASVFNPVPSTTSSCDKKVRSSMTIVLAAPHMHLLGRSLKIELNPDSKSPIIILNRSNYDFDDQSATVLKTPIKISAGDVLRVTCTYDPKLRQLLPELKNLPARYVTWGEGSSDEMCLGILGVTK